MQWLSLVSGRTPNANLFAESSFWIAKYRQLFLNNRPFRAFDEVVGNTQTHFQSWVAHPSRDDHWLALSLSDEDYNRIDMPILTITGHYDGDQLGAMHYYRRHMASTSPSREQHYLIIGPWDHAGTRTPSAEFGGLKLDEACLLDMNELHTDWYAWTLQRGPKPEFLKKRVAYYVTGAEEWKYADSLASISDATRRLYLNSTNGQANDVFHSGMLQESPPESSAPDHYIYDPLDVRPAELEQDQVKDYLTDQRYALNLFGNGLVYHSQPMAEDVEVSGNVRLVVWIELDVPDTDFWVTLYEIQANGESIQLAEDFLRARYRESLRQQELVTPGEINRYDFDSFNFFSRRIAKGSRLRLVIKAPNSIYVEKNYNSGGVVAEESTADARTAHVTLYHDQEHSSYLELPISGS
jgi:putative CocE/NonD family hydrolase